MSKKMNKYLIWDEDDNNFNFEEASSPEDAIKKYCSEFDGTEEDSFLLQVFPMSAAIEKLVTVKAETKVKITITDKKTKA
jgi:hypothetical protein